MYNSLLNKHYLKSQVQFMFYFTERKDFYIHHTHSRNYSGIQALGLKLVTNAAHVTPGLSSHLSEVVWVIFSHQMEKKKKRNYTGC